jgi:hypothetical protein
MNALFVRLSVVLALAFAGTDAMLAGPLPASDVEQVQRVIAAQLAAFAVDDADRAFDTATPQVRKAIGSSGRFLALVRGAYPMVYRPAAVTFHKPREDRGAVLQLVEIRDADAKSWLALFALERQPDASWRIGGCVVTENRWLQT